MATLTIPGAPENGGDLAKYLSKYSSEIGWMPGASSAIAKDIQRALSAEGNDPAAWVSYAATTLQQVWGSMPPEARSAVRDALSQLVVRGMQGVQAVEGVAQAAAGSAASAVPLIGAIIEGLLVAVFGFIKLAKTNESARYQTAAAHFMDSTRWTVEQYTHPNSWVLKKSKVTNYLNRYDRDWWNKPSFSRSGGGSDLIFTTSAGKADSGKCSGQGVEMYCGARTSVNMGDCRKRDDDETYCTRYVMISALFYPFWSPAYPDKTSVTEKAIGENPNYAGRGTFEASVVTANTLLVARQMALLTSPSVNLRVSASRVLRFRDRFTKWFFGRYTGKYGGERGVLPVNRSHIVQRGKGSRWIDPEKAKDLPGDNDLNRFYLDDDGIIHAYLGDDMADWGVLAKRGPQSPTDVAVTIAQYNTVVSATLAFMSARANFLRNGSMMKVLLKDAAKNGAFDSQVRDAMEYAANADMMLPPPVAAGGVIPTRKKKVVIPGRSKKPSGDSSGGGAAVAVVGAGAVVGLLAFLRR